MGFCSCTVKFVLIVFNLACALAGVAILTIGILTNSNGGSFKSMLSGQVTTTAICFMVLGAIVFLIAFFGCCGALREDTCMIQTYGVLLLTIFLFEIAIGIAVFVLKSQVQDDLKHNFEGYFSNYSKNKKYIDDIQTSLQCCGYDGPSFWQNLSPQQPIPNSCCKNQHDCDISNSYQWGCYSTARDYLKKIMNVVGGVAIGIAAVELVGIIFAFYFASSIKRSERRGYV